MNRSLFNSYIFTLVLLVSSTAWADPIVRTVRTAEDGVAQGSLRLLLQAACDEDGDDKIVFGHTRLNEIRIVLDAPLVIPQDCRGHVTLHGSDEVETILDGSQIPGVGDDPGELCLLNVYTRGNVIEGFTFAGHENSSGVCLFGRYNEVTQNHFNEPGRGFKYALVISNVFKQQFPEMDGLTNIVHENQFGAGGKTHLWVNSNKNKIESNQLEGSSGVAVHLGGDANQFQDNEIRSNADTGLELAGTSNQISKNTFTSNQGDGLYVVGSQHEITDNEITQNLFNGIRIHATNVTISHNHILHNGGCVDPAEKLLSDNGDCLDDANAAGYGIEVERGSTQLTIGGDGIGLENTIQYNHSGGVVVFGGHETDQIQVSHNIISKNYGSPAGIDLNGDGLTLNDDGDADEGPNHLLNFIDFVRAIPLNSSADGLDRYWLWGLAYSGHSIEAYTVDGEDLERGITNGGGTEYVDDAAIVRNVFKINPNEYFTTGDFITFVVHDNHNTSEFSQNFEIGPDADGDGILDRLEGNDESNNPDSDDDGLPDDIEDQNLNGRCERNLNETCANNADTDGDGLSDFIETHGDGIFDRGVDTNPLVADTDGDGILDGREDTNHNGLWDSVLGETNPRSTDSDRDHLADAADNCPSIFNPGQQAWMCRR